MGDEEGEEATYLLFISLRPEFSDTAPVNNKGDWEMRTLIRNIVPRMKCRLCSKENGENRLGRWE